MAIIIGVRFREVGKIYYFDPKSVHYNIGDKVVVETSRGMELGTVVIPTREIQDESITLPLKEVVRLATTEDLETDRSNREKEFEALKLCRVKAKEQGLDMKVISAEYTFDNSKVLFHFIAEGRIDFRELVKELAAVFRTRIELRQVGVRDETKIVGGIGSCGRALCCHSYLTKFAPVSIKMAKEQNLSLNPQKISGVCGRLMCCLKNEAETYEYLNAKMPKDGDFVELTDGQRGVVSFTSVLRQKFKILVTRNGDEKELLEYTVKDIANIIKRKKYHQMQEELASFQSEEEVKSIAEPRGAGKNRFRANAETAKGSEQEGRFAQGGKEMRQGDKAEFRQDGKKAGKRLGQKPWEADGSDADGNVSQKPDAAILRGNAKRNFDKKKSFPKKSLDAPVKEDAKGAENTQGKTEFKKKKRFFKKPAKG